MYYSKYKDLYPDDILVSIEDFNRERGEVLFDFIDSNEYGLFADIGNSNYDLDKPSMVFLTHYKGKPLKQNTIYAIKSPVVNLWRQQSNIALRTDSFLIGFQINALNTPDVFGSPVSIRFEDSFYLHNFIYGGGKTSDIYFPYKSKISITVRNVGQGNWNEISFDNTAKIVYDAGAPVAATKADVIKIIGDRNLIYPSSKPLLILSHWDKDHYHSLIAMSNAELTNNFSGFICRDQLPNLTSRILFGRIKSAIGINNIFAIQAAENPDDGLKYFTILNPSDHQVIIYNALHKKSRNLSGIVVLVRTSTGSAILSGDTNYKYISRDMLYKLNYKHLHNLVVPHHGGNAGTYHYKLPSTVKPHKAVISVGLNHHNHPRASNITALGNDGFKVIQTNMAGAVTINL